MVKHAFTMIELIFSLVVMGFILISIPTVMATAEEAKSENIIQEAIFASATKINQMLSYSWDANSINPTTTFTYARVLDAGGNVNFNRNGATNFRIGHLVQSGHRRLFSAVTAPTGILGQEGTGIDDIDDFNAVVNQNLFIEDTTQSTGYKKNYLISVDVDYVSDSNNSLGNLINYNNVDPIETPFIFNGTSVAVGTSNLKRITIQVDENLSTGVIEPISTLQVYSANIGEIDFHSRTY